MSTFQRSENIHCHSVRNSTMAVSLSSGQKHKKEYYGGREIKERTGAGKQHI